MTDRELRLRKRIDAVRDERDAARRDAARLRAQLNRRRRCVYCGGHTRGIACAAHADLLRVDPHYAKGAS